MTITPMAESQIDRVCALLRDAYRLVESRDALTAEQARFLIEKRGSAECVRRESRHQRYLVAREADRIVGIVAVSGDAITKLYVAPDRVGEGIGRRLYDAAEAAIRAGGHRRVTLHAFPGAVPFYRRMGLSVQGWKDPAGPLAGLRAAVMEKELDPGDT